MNITKFQLPSITCNHNQSRSILDIVVHTILFARTLGIPLSCKEVESYLFDNLIYLVINDEPIIHKVKDQLAIACQSKKRNILPVSISLFYSSKKYGILGEYYEKVEFERWKIELNYVTKQTFADEDAMRKEMNAILDTIWNTKELPEQLPPYDKFSFTIMDDAANHDSGGGGMYDMFKSIPRMFGTP